MRYITIEEQLKNERKKTAALHAAQAQDAADIEYIAMMCDVELDTPEDTDRMNDEGG